MQIDDVGGAAAVDVGQPDALVVELIRVVEMRRVVHRNLGTEPAVAEVGPITDLAIADTDQVGESVAAEIREINRSSAIGKYEPRTLLLVQCLCDSSGRAEAFLRKRRVPDERVLLCNEHVGMPVAVEVDELQVGVTHVAIETRHEGAEGLPSFGLVVLEQPGHRPVEHHDVGLPVAGQIHELRRTTSQREVGLGANKF